MRFAAQPHINGIRLLVAAALGLGLLPREALDHPIGRRLAWVPCAALGATGLLLAIIDQTWVTRIGVLLFVPLTIGRAATEDRLRLLPFLAAGLFLLLLASPPAACGSSAARPFRCPGRASRRRSPC